jgi:hypothetical protein
MATGRMPRSRRVRMTRTAISPRLATSTVRSGRGAGRAGLWDMGATSRLDSGRNLAELPAAVTGAVRHSSSRLRSRASEPQGQLPQPKDEATHWIHSLFRLRKHPCERLRSRASEPQGQLPQPKDEATHWIHSLFRLRKHAQGAGGTSPGAGMGTSTGRQRVWQTGGGGGMGGSAGSTGAPPPSQISTGPQRGSRSQSAGRRPSQ